MKLISYLIAIICTTSLTACSGNKNSSDDVDSTLSVFLNEDDDMDDVEDGQPSLNDIRFNDWDSDQWLDNEYIRTLRHYLDMVVDGIVLNENIEEYDSLLEGKFVIGEIEPALLGGAFIQFVFIEEPSKLFAAWVYSDVDEESKKVTGYEVRSVDLVADNLEFTKEEILKMMEAHPEIKPW